MTRSETDGRPFFFFAWVLALSVPFYVWGVLAPVRGLPFGLPATAAMVVVPALLATIMTAPRRGTATGRALWRRVLDTDRIEDTRCLAAAVLIMPLTSFAAYVSMALLGLPLPDALHVPLEQIPLMIMVYVIGAVFEEIGWTAYATEPLQERHGVLGGGIVIGLVWALWHVVPWWFGQRHALSWVAGQAAATVLTRVIMGFIYARCGRSLFLAIIFHAMINISYSLFPNSGSHYNPIVLASVLMPIVAFLVVRENSFPR